MDKKQLQGLLVICLILIIYAWWFMPKPPADQKKNIPGEKTDSLQKDTSVISSMKPEGISILQKNPTQHDSVFSDTSKSIREKYGEWLAGLTGEEKKVILENKDIKILLNTYGAKIQEIELKNYKTWEKKPLKILDINSSSMHWKFSSNNRIFDLTEFYYQHTGNNHFVKENDTVSITFTLPLNEEKKVEMIYSLAGTGFELTCRINCIGFKNEVTYGNNPLEFSWSNRMIRNEQDLTYNRQHATVNFLYANGDFENLSESNNEFQQEPLPTPVKWISFKDKFFSSAIISDATFESGLVKCEVMEADTLHVKYVEMQMDFPWEKVLSGEGNFRFYFGPNNYLKLKKVTAGFEKNLYLGWGIFGWVNRYVIIPVFNWLEKYFTNYGLIIFLLVFIIKLGLFPLTYKSYLSMAKTKVLKPELDALKKKIGDDMTKFQQESMKLYKSAGVNPLGGCIPQLLQIPILFAMFTFFPASIELRQKSFLWAPDLSTYDSILDLPFTIPFYGSHVSLFTILMTASTLIYTWMNQQMTAAATGQMKFLSYAMPVIFMFVLNSFPAALTYYYFLSNVITFGQMALIRSFVDENKIRQEIEQNKLKPPKQKSAFQQRLEKAAKTRGVRVK